MCEIHRARLRLWHGLARACHWGTRAALALGCLTAAAALWRAALWMLVAALALAGLLVHLAWEVCDRRRAAAAAAQRACPMCQAQRTAWV